MSKRTFEEKPLYRIADTCERGVFHSAGPGCPHQRSTRCESGPKAAGAAPGKTTQGRQRGLDDLPLVRCFHSRQGQRLAGVLQRVNSEIDTYRLWPHSPCCPLTFKGGIFSAALLADRRHPSLEDHP